MSSIPKARIFISYRNVTSSRTVAQHLAQQFSDDGYHVFWDVDSLGGGDLWAQTIYEAIFAADVLIVLLEPDTAESDWVQREVDVARGAHVAILPISIVPNLSATNVAERLAIRDTQFLRYHSDTTDYERIVQRVETLRVRTRTAQEEWHSQLRQKWRDLPAEDHLHYATFQLEGHPCQLHLATGSILNTYGIDVIVNTENDHMQMARIHERETISSVLRYSGSLMRGAHIVEDTIQMELDLHIAQNPDLGGRPVRLCQVIPTSAGHPRSELRKRTSARYIFHTAVVSIQHRMTAMRVQPISTDDEIAACVRHNFEMVEYVNGCRGVISPMGTTQYEEQVAAEPTYQPLSSIIFPIFGTGQGGLRSTVDVVQPMLRTFHHYLRQYPNTSLRDIYVCAYRLRDVDQVLGEFQKVFGRV